jgi:hypothetical protein
MMQLARLFVAHAQVENAVDVVCQIDTEFVRVLAVVHPNVQIREYVVNMQTRFLTFG